MAKETIYLVDGTSLSYRSFFAIKLSTSAGLPTGAVFGFYKTLKKIISQYKPTHMAICFDVSRKTHRSKKFKEYKVNRPPTPQDLQVQFGLIRELTRLLGIEVVEKEGFEADDVIASLCKKSLKQGNSVVIVSSDKDLYQLMDTDRVTFYRYNTDSTLTKTDFMKEFGFSPEYIVDYLSLVGDSTDNIPGAKGIGKVSGLKLIREFRDVDNVFKNLDKVSSKQCDILKKEKENIFLSKELVKLCPYPIDLDFKDFKIKEPSKEGLYEMFSKLEFKALLRDFSFSSFKSNIELKEGLPKEFLKDKTRKKLFFYSKAQDVFVFDDLKNCTYKDKADVLRDLDRTVEKISYGLKNQNSSLDLSQNCFDIKIAAYLLNSSFSDYSLTSLVFHYLGENTSSVQDKDYPYFICQIYSKLKKEIKKENLDKLFYDLEMPLIAVLKKMQKQGVKVDADKLKKLLKEVDSLSQSAQKEIFKIAGKEFNLNSPKQLGSILFEDLKIPPLKRTKTGYSTAEDVLDKLSSKYPIASFILEYRQLNKLKTTYVCPLIEEVTRHDGMLHTTFNQTATQTGRLSSSSPNLQSIPTKGELSAQLRRAFVSSFSDQGCLLSGDYSQIELRILAHLSGDDKLIEAFKKDRDIHNFTAALLFGLKDDQIDSESRNIAKRVNFGIVYGMSSYGLSRELKISPQEAQIFIDDYFQRYPKVKEYISRVLKQVEKKKFVQTILGRKRWLPEISSSNLQLREFARRQAMNAPIQGSCADLIKIAMVNIDRDFNSRRLKTKLILQIHDELIFDVYSDEVEEVKSLVKKNMEEALKLDVPIKVNLKLGKNWANVESID